MLNRMLFLLADNLKVEGNAPEEEILSVVDVRVVMMGRVFGRRGASILAIKESCKYTSPTSSVYLHLFSAFLSIAA